MGIKFIVTVHNQIDAENETNNNKSFTVFSRQRIRSIENTTQKNWYVNYNIYLQWLWPAVETLEQRLDLTEAKRAIEEKNIHFVRYDMRG